MKNIKWTAIVMALGYIAAGVYFFMFPDTSEDMIRTILGFALIGVGIINIIAYFVRSNEESFLRDDFKDALIMITIGCFALAFKELFIELVYLVIGIIIMISGYSKLQDCVDTWRFGANHGPLYIVLALVSIAAGLVAAINPFTSTQHLHYLIGGALIFSGVSDLFSSIYLSTKMVQLKSARRKEEQEAMEAAAEEETVSVEPAFEPISIETVASIPEEKPVEEVSVEETVAEDSSENTQE
ncbi:MAG: DUF308 domain-containing protein [Erysipelotrichaceae bacterium]|nr:DUF308 domain-containing protein [Erysipelotrichaceae bacterium]